MPTDVQGKAFAEGQKVARAVSLNRGGSCTVQVCKVTSIDGNKVYLDNSPQPIKFHSRLAILS